MRGSENVMSKPHPPLGRQPLPPSQLPPSNGSHHSYKSSARQDSANSGSPMDLTSVSGQKMVKHRRTPGTTSDHYISYKRALNFDVLKDTGNDVISRPTKTKVAKSKSDGITVELKNPKYASLTSYSRLPKRSKVPKTKGKNEKLDVSKLPKSDGAADRPLLGRRSRTFVVESHGFLLDSSSDPVSQKAGNSLHHLNNRPNTDFVNKSEATVGSRNNDRSLNSGDPVLKNSCGPRESGFRGASQWGERREQEDFRSSQWKAERESLREGARNPLQSGLPARPKSAGQLRYYDSEDSDESSLDGEIEIVDIDKELEDDPEPSPYWSEVQPLQVPEVFVQPNASASSSLGETNPSQGKDGLNIRRSSLQPDSHHPQTNHSLLLQQQPTLLSRQRHGSGESDLSAFSDSLVKPVQPRGRRRFMSEPEILNLEEERLGMRKNSKARKGGHFQGEPRFREVGVLDPGTSTVEPMSRERLYSDTMERVLSRYSEMGLNEQHEDANGKGRPSRIPVGSNSVTSGSRVSASGHMVPPRKLKPILKQPRHDSYDGLS